MAGKSDIEAEVVEIDGGKTKQLLEAARYNSRHGKPLSKEERRNVARDIFKNGDVKNKDVAEALGMSAGWVSNATDDLAKKNREERRDLSCELYLNYNEYPTQQIVADKLDVSQDTVKRDLNEKFNSEDFVTASAFNDEEPPEWVKVDNSWNFSKCSPSFGTKWPGSNSTIVLLERRFKITRNGFFEVQPPLESSSNEVISELDVVETTVKDHGDDKDDSGEIKSEEGSRPTSTRVLLERASQYRPSGRY